MVTREQKDRAKRLAAKSQGNIKVKILLSRGTGISGGLLPNNYLHDKPILEYLSQNEQPHYFFYNESNGVQIGELEEKSGWSGKYRNSMWVTDKGLHFTVGRSSGDFHYFLPFSSIWSVNVKTGAGKNEFIFETHEGRARFATKPTFDVDSASGFISQKISSLSSARNEDKETHAAGSKKTNKKEKGTDPVSKEKARNEKARNEKARNEKARKVDRSVQSTGRSGERSLSTLRQIDVYDFEHLIARVWKEQGWETQVSSRSTDKGIDITAVKSDPFEQRQYIQAKRYAEGNKVGSSEVQKCSGLYTRNESVDAVVVVTTSEFTKEAEEVAANRNVKLVNGTQLMKMIKRYDVSVNDLIDNKLVNNQKISEEGTNKTPQNWAEAIDKLQANITEEETEYDVLSKTKNAETSWPRSLTPVSDLDEIRNTLIRCINEAFEEETQGVIKWNATEFDYAVIIEFSEEEKRNNDNKSGKEISIEIAKKGASGGEDLEINSVSSLGEELDYTLKLRTDGTFNSVRASRNTFNDDFSILDELSTIEYIIEKLTGQTLQDISYVSVVDPEQFG